MANVDLVLKAIFLPALDDEDLSEMDDQLQLSKSTPIGDSSWDEEISTVEKRARGTLAQRLGVVRTEIRQEDDGARCVYAFNAANELVDVRWLLPFRRE